MNNRRRLIVALGAGAFTAPLSGYAQQQAKVWRVGILANFSASDKLPESFTQGLRERGYIEGTNLAIERRFAEGDVSRMDELAADLVRQKPEVIFAPNSISVNAAKKATGSIPIIFCIAADPVGSGFVASLARPGGNITGSSNIPQDLSAKRLQLLKEAVPNIARVAAFEEQAQGVGAIYRNQVEEVRRAAKILGMEIIVTRIQQREDFDPVAGQLRKWRADSILVVSSPANTFNRKLLIEFAEKMRLPAVYADKPYAEGGGLITYGPSIEALYHLAASYVDKILKGAKPSDLPVEQPSKFELIVNVKTAKALGIKIPQSILLRADKVIE